MKTTRKTTSSYYLHICNDTKLPKLQPQQKQYCISTVAATAAVIVLFSYFSYLSNGITFGDDDHYYFDSKRNSSSLNDYQYYDEYSNSSNKKKKQKGDDYTNKKQVTASSIITEPVATATKRKRRIMIIDDEKDITDVFRIGLEYKGFEVDAYTDSFQALFNFKVGYYDVIISDVHIPGMNGFELCKELVRIDNNVKIFFVSGIVIFADKLKLQYPNLDEKHFIDKPISIDKLMSRISEEVL